MYTLRIKLLRELWQLKWQNFAIASVMAAGVAVIVMSVSTLQSLQTSRSKFYEQSRFGQAFVHLKRAPRTVIPRIREIIGVQSAEARVVTQVNLVLPNMTEPAAGRIVSLPVHGKPSVNQLHLIAGRYLSVDRPGEVLLTQGFADANKLRPGDTLTVIINGKETLLQVAGIVLSAEFIYSVRPGELLPDDKRYGILWMGYEELSALCDLSEAFNDLSITFAYGASETAILNQLDHLLADYGGTNAYGRDLQASHRFLENELIQLRTMATVPPAIFLVVTVFLIQVVVSRQISIQREQIAMMRAFGYRSRELVLHYLAFGIIVGLGGVAMGTLVGAKLGFDLTQLYTRFFRFPSIDYKLDWQLVLITGMVTLGAIVAGVWRSVWKSISIPPSQAMQPESPPSFRRSILERIGFQIFFSTSFRMILRHLERSPMRSLLSSTGIALAVAILVMGNFVQDTVEHTLDFQFFSVHRQDLQVTFTEPTSRDAIFELKRFPGVRAIEPFRAVSVRLVHHHHRRRMEVLGLPASSQLFRVVDPSRGPVELRPGGLILSRRLADLLDCRCGDQIRVEVLEGSRIVLDVPVVATVDDYLDMSAYMEINSLRRLLQEQDNVSGVSISINKLDADELYKRLQELPRVAGVSIKRSDIENYQKTMAENVLRMKFLNMIFASILAVGVVYNCARISLAERSRDLATLRVLGFTRAETSRILIGEMMLLVLVAIPFGLIMGYGLSWMLCLSLNTELHRFPLVVSNRTYVTAVAVVLLASLFSAMIVRRRIDRLDLVEVLKARA